MKIKPGDCVYLVHMKAYGLVLQKGIIPNTYLVYVKTDNPDHAKNGYQWLVHQINLMTLK